MASRAIFLDFDGVLHPASDVADYASGATPDIPLKQFALQRDLLRWTPVLAELLAGHDDVMLIVHSGWRTRCQDYELREFLGPLAPWFAGSTGVGARYRSIRALVDRFGIDDFIVIDDAHAEFPAGWESLVCCDPDLGVTCPSVQQRIRAWLASSAGAGSCSERQE